MKKAFNCPVFALLVFSGVLRAQQIPQLLSYQGRVASGGVNFNGPGQFKSALVNDAGTVTANAMFIKEHRRVQEKRATIAEQEKQIQSLGARLNELESRFRNAYETQGAGNSSTVPAPNHP